MIKQCLRCKKEKRICARNLCMSCYQFALKDKSNIIEKRLNCRTCMKEFIAEH